MLQMIIKPNIGTILKFLLSKICWFEFDDTNSVNADRYNLKINEGTIVIFPSHLEHSVERNNSNENRYSVAFNFFVRGKFGKEEYELEIKWVKKNLKLILII